MKKQQDFAALQRQTRARKRARNIVVYALLTLWGVVVLMWTYLTPIFYPETIIPAQLITLYHMNPMYQFIYFMRCITLGGVSPTPVTYLYCTLCSVVPLLVGLWVFKKNQDRFVFYL